MFQKSQRTPYFLLFENREFAGKLLKQTFVCHNTFHDAKVVKVVQLYNSFSCFLNVSAVFWLLLSATGDLIRGERVVRQCLDAIQILFAFCGVAHCLGFVSARAGRFFLRAGWPGDEFLTRFRGRHECRPYVAGKPPVRPDGTGILSTWWMVIGVDGFIL